MALQRCRLKRAIGATLCNSHSCELKYQSVSVTNCHIGVSRTTSASEVQLVWRGRSLSCMHAKPPSTVNLIRRQTCVHAARDVIR
jgi:hypothetical protein